MAEPTKEGIEALKLAVSNTLTTTVSEEEETGRIIARTNSGEASELDRIRIINYLKHLFLRASHEDRISMLNVVQDVKRARAKTRKEAAHA